MILNAATLAAFFTGLRTEFRNGFEGAPSDWDKIATLVSSTTASNSYTWLGMFPSLKEWIGDKDVKNLKAHGYTIKNRDFESTIEVDRNDIEDDNIGVYAPLANGAGYSSKVWPDELVFALLKTGFSAKCYDGKPFFSTSHPVGKNAVSNFGGGSGTPWFLLDVTKPLKPLIFQQRKKPKFIRIDQDTSENVFMRRKFLFGVESRGDSGFGFWQMAYASKDTLNAENYAAARSAMMSCKDENDRPLGVRPTLLVVPPTLEKNALEVVKAERDASGATNIYRDTAEVLMSPWLA